ncbi:MAG: caspase family protein [Thermoplasmata archaeon]
MKIKMCVLIAAGLLIGFFSLSSAEPSKRCFGLFVGIEDYQNHSPAQYADESAHHIYERLKEKKNWDTTRMILLLNSQATKSAIKESIQSIGNRIGSDPDDMFLFYFAGHGHKDYYHHYLMPYDADPNNSQTWISDIEFRNWIDQYSQANYRVVILDACYSGGMYGGGIVWGLSSLPPEFIPQSGGFHAVLSELASTFGEPEGGMVALLSCGPDELSYVHPTHLLGCFTYYVAQAISINHDPNQDKKTSAEEIFAYAASFFPGAACSQNPVMIDRCEDTLWGEELPVVFHNWVILQKQTVAKIYSQGTHS